MTALRVKPTVLLVHDAFDDTSGWSSVIGALHARTIDATAVGNPLAGLRRDAAYVASVAGGIDGPVLLAGHGYGGAVISVAADASANVRAVVFVAAFAPDEGESCVDLLRTSVDPRPITALRPAVVQREDGPATIDAVVRRDRFREMVAGDVPLDAAEILAAQQRAVAASALEERAAAAAWRRLASWRVIATHDRLVPLDVQHRMAVREGSETTEVIASHAVARTQAEDVAAVIARAVERAAG